MKSSNKLYIVYNNKNQIVSVLERVISSDYLMWPATDGYTIKEQSKTKALLIQMVIIKCVNEELYPYDITYEDVIKGGKHEFKKVFKFKVNKTLFGFIKYPTFFEKVPWYQYYTFKREEDFLQWKAFCLMQFAGVLKYTKVEAEKEFSWFNLNWGLKQDYLVK